MLAEYLRSQTDSLIGSQCAVRINIQGQLIIVCHLTDTGILYCHIYSLNGSVNGINSDNTDRKIIALVLVSTYISSALGDCQLHVKLAVLATAQMSDDKIRIQNFDILISLNIGSVYHAFALKLNVCGFRLVGLAAVLDCKTLDIHDDLSYIFLHAGNGTELVQHAFDFHLANCCTG